MSCYAYREPSVEESFEKHSRDVVKTMEELDEYRGFLKVLEKRYGISSSDAAPFLRLAAAMHDLGKIDEEYQSVCNGKDRKCTNFPGHYDASARVLALAYMRATNSNSLALLDLSREGLDLSREDVKSRDALFATLVVIPVELHHYAQIEWLKTRIKFKPAAQCVKAVVDILKELKLDGILGKVANELKELVSGGIDSPICREAAATAPTIRSAANSGIRPCEIDLPFLNLFRHIRLSNTIRPDLAFIAEAATGLINRADGLTAKQNRQRGR